MVVVAALVAAGCSVDGGDDAAKRQAAPARLSVLPAQGAQKVAPDAGVTVRVADGRITQVPV
ncbi:MAG: hypothetical protein ACRDOO_01285, partial [Actinomadura sp.]